MEGFDFSGAQWLFVWIGIIYSVISFFSFASGLGILAVSMLFSPEISLGEIGIPEIFESRNVVVRIEDLLMPILVLSHLCQATIRKRRLLVPSPLDRPILLLLMVMVVSTVHGYLTGWILSPLLGAFYFLKLVQYFTVFFLVLNYLQSERQVKLFLSFVLVTLAGVAVYTLVQVPQTELYTAKRITAPFEGKPEPTTVGGYMVFLQLIVFSLFLHAQTPLKKWCFASLGGLIFIPFLFTFSRSSYAALVAGIVAMALIARKKWLNYFFAFLIVLTPFLLPAAVKERIAFTWEDAKHPYRVLGVDYSLQERIFSFKNSWFALKHNPVYGVGISSTSYPDNQYSRTLHEIGFLGLGLWIWIFVRLFKMGHWLYQYLDEGVLKGLALGYSAGIVGILCHAFGTTTFYLIRIMEPFWFISGLVVALYLIKTRELFLISESTKSRQRGRP